MKNRRIEYQKNGDSNPLIGIVMEIFRKNDHDYLCVKREDTNNSTLNNKCDIVSFDTIKKFII